jgi:asparagine synthase (glutamine-hydrolysing)
MRYARAVAQHLGVRHNVLEVDAKAFCAGIEPSVLHLEDVVSEAIAVPNFLLAREAARSADALFTGEGGDQSFGGPKNVGMALAYAYAGHPAAPPLAHTYVSLHHYLWSDLGEALHPRVLEAFDPERLAAEVGGRFFAGAYASKGRSFVGRVMLGNTVVKGGSNILVKAAKMIGLAHDLALRSPMFDRRLVDLAFTIPPWQKADGTDEKLVLRRAALRSLPAWVVNRPKRGMTLPLASWFAGELGELARDVLTERAVRQRGLLNWSYVERLLAARPTTQEHRRARTADKLWLALVTELHHRAIDTVARDARGRPDVRASTRAPGEAAHA